MGRRGYSKGFIGQNFSSLVLIYVCRFNSSGIELGLRFTDSQVKDMKTLFAIRNTSNNLARTHEGVTKNINGLDPLCPQCLFTLGKSQEIVPPVDASDLVSYFVLQTIASLPPNSLKYVSH